MAEQEQGYHVSMGIVRPRSDYRVVIGHNEDGSIRFGDNLTLEDAKVVIRLYDKQIRDLRARLATLETRRKRKAASE